MTALSDDLVVSHRQDENHPSAADDFLAIVEQRLESFLDERCGILLAVSPDLEPVARTLRDLARGGKRLRATFCHWGWRGAGALDQDAAVDGAAAVELFHLAALVHDDVMDRSATRRGSPTAHELFAQQHRAEQLDGDPAEFGTGAAVLIGDLCLMWSDELLSAAPQDPSRRVATRRVYDVMRTQVVAGQYLDMLEQDRPGIRAEASHTVLRFKSAKYSVEHPLMLGGALSGATDDIQAAYSSYGVAVGEAFQLRDDVLGVFGDPTHTGKPVGDDLREGKKTLLVLAGLDRADLGQRRILQHRLGDRAMTDRQIREVQDVLVRTGALDHVESQIAELTRQGVAAIRRSSVPTTVATALADLALRIAGRTA